MAMADMSEPRRALVTGGASGFGLGVARALLEEGANVAIGDVHRGRLDEAAESLGRGERLLPIELDVTSGDSVRAAVAACEDAFGGLDALVNSAGVIRFTPLDEITEEEWDLVVGVDLKGVFLCCQAAAPLLRRSGRGRIVNLSSDAGKVGFPMISTYVTAKHGVIGLTKSSALEYAGSGIRINAVCPGSTRTPMIDDITGHDPDMESKIASGQPLGRMGAPEEIAAAVVWLCSDASSFVTGHALSADGGMVAGLFLTS
jgi:NAD(P)-dependent dehydrogenase (short-subunit alcohol dehydrogenase family)